MIREWGSTFDRDAVFGSQGLDEPVPILPVVVARLED